MLSPEIPLPTTAIFLSLHVAAMLGYKQESCLRSCMQPCGGSAARRENVKAQISQPNNTRVTLRAGCDSKSDSSGSDLVTPKLHRRWQCSPSPLDRATQLLVSPSFLGPERHALLGLLIRLVLNATASELLLGRLMCDFPPMRGP